MILGDFAGFNRSVGSRNSITVSDTSVPYC